MATKKIQPLTGTIDQQTDQCLSVLAEQRARYEAEAPARAERQQKRQVVLNLIPTLRDLINDGFSPEKISDFLKTGGISLSASLIRRVLVEEQILPSPKARKKAAPKGKAGKGKVIFSSRGDDDQPPPKPSSSPRRPRRGQGGVRKKA